MNEYSHIKAVAFDMDGTLLHSDGCVSLYTLDVLARCKRAGLHIIAVTGRPRQACRVLTAVHPLLSAEIYNNGGDCWKGERRLFSHAVPGTEAAAIMRRLTQRFPGLPVAAETEKGLYAGFDAHLWWPSDTAFVRTDWNEPIPDTYKLTTMPLGLGTSRQTHVPFDQPFSETAIRETFPAHLPVLIMERGWIVQALPENVDKAQGLSEELQLLGLSLCDCVAFGDDGNDIGMLQAAGVGVAMGNAFPYVLQAVPLQALPNDQEGMARWLEKHVL